jgi:hypothetical protein
MAGANEIVLGDGGSGGIEVYYSNQAGGRLFETQVGLGAGLPCGCGPNSARGVEVVIQKSVSSFLAGLMGQDAMNVEAIAQAKYGPIVSPDGNVYPATRCDPTEVADCPALNVGQIGALRLVDYDSGEPGHHYGNFGFLSWNGDNNTAVARLGFTPPGTYHNPALPQMDYFNPGQPSFQGNSVKWNNPIPSDDQLTVNKWVQGLPGNKATIFHEMEEYWVNQDRVMIIPVYKDAIGRGQNSGFLVSNFAAFKVTCANFGGAGNRVGNCIFLDDFPQSEKWMEGYFLGYVATGAWGEGCTTGGLNAVKLVR